MVVIVINVFGLIVGDAVLGFEVLFKIVIN